MLLRTFSVSKLYSPERNDKIILQVAWPAKRAQATAHVITFVAAIINLVVLN